MTAFSLFPLGPCLLLVLLLLLLIATAASTNYPVEKHIFHAAVDHYSFRNTSRTFELSYYVNEEHWNATRQGGPVLFYAGNEAPISQFIRNSGFMFEIAPEFGAMVVFAEHDVAFLVFWSQSVTSVSQMIFSAMRLSDWRENPMVVESSRQSHSQHSNRMSQVLVFSSYVRTPRVNSLLYT